MLLKCLKTIICSRASKKIKFTSICSDDHKGFVTLSNHCALVDILWKNLASTIARFYFTSMLPTFLGYRSYEYIICFWLQEELGQTLVVKLPETLSICHEPPLEHSLAEMEKLLLLILGAAVQCSHKEDLIGSIKNLPIETQHAFVEKIKEVTENPKLIWSSQVKNILIWQMCYFCRF